MFRNKNYLVLSFIIVLSSCSYINDSNSNKAKKKTSNNGFYRALKITKENFSAKYLDHFPKKVYSDYTIKSVYPNKNYRKIFYGTTIVSRINPTEFASRIDEIQFNNYEKFKYHDSCTFILSEQLPKKCNSIPNCRCELFIIPDIDAQLQEYNNFDYEISDFDLYLIESDTIRIFEDSFFLNNRNIPECWLHGFSKGIGYSDKWQLEIVWILFW